MMTSQSGVDLPRRYNLICDAIIQHVVHRNLHSDVPWLAGRIPTVETLAVAFWERLGPHLADGTLRSRAGLGNREELGGESGRWLTR